MAFCTTFITFDRTQAWFDFRSMSFAISVPVRDDNGYLHVPVRIPKWPPAVNVSGALVASGREFVADSRERAVTGGPFYRFFLADLLFSPKPN